MAAIAVALAMATAFAERAPGVGAQGVVTFDIDPDTSGNSATALGTIENCVEITIPAPAFDNTSDYNIDIVVLGDTQAPLDYYAELVYDATKVHIADPGTDDLIKMPGAVPLGEPRPGSDGTHSFAALYPTGGPGLAGDSALVRVGLDIGGSGIVTFRLNEPPQTGYTSEAGAHAVELSRGHLAINASCADLAVGGIAELPQVGGSGATNRTVLAASAAAAILALTAGAWYASRRMVS